MKFLTAALIAFACVSVRSLDPCKTRPKQDLLQSGSVQLMNNLDNPLLTQEYMVHVQYDMPETSEFAVALQNTNGYSFSAGYDYSIHASRKVGQNAIVIGFRNKESNWKKIDISYLVSSIADIRLGNFIIPQVGKLAKSKSTEPSTSLQLVNKVNISGQKNIHEVKAFLSGLLGPALNSIAVKDAKYNSETNEISVNFLADQIELIEQVEISYVMWKVDNAFQVFEILPSYHPFDSDYRINGIVGFDQQKSTVNGVAVSSDRITCTGSGCADSCTNISKCRGRLIKNKCIQCGINENTEEDGTCTLKQCSQNQQLNNGVCQCKTGFNRIKNACGHCDQNSHYDIDREDCICNFGFYKYQGSCLPCHETCGACRGAGDQKCVTCANNKYTLINKKCILKETPPLNPQPEPEPSKPVAEPHPIVSQPEPEPSKPVAEPHPIVSQPEPEPPKPVAEPHPIVSQPQPEPPKPVAEPESKPTLAAQPQTHVQNLNHLVDAPQNSNTPLDTPVVQPNGQAQKTYTLYDYSQPVVPVKPELSLVSGNALIQDGTVFKGITLINLPAELTSNEQLCNRLLKVSLTNSVIVPGIRTQFLPYSRYPRILISFDFGYVKNPPPFSYEVRINPDLSDHFSASQLEQKIVDTIDPSILVRRSSDRNLRMTYQEIADFDVALTQDEEDFIFG